MATTTALKREMMLRSQQKQQQQRLLKAQLEMLLFANKILLVCTLAF